MIDRITSLPRNFVKYYKASTLEDFLKISSVDLDEIELYESFVSSALNYYGVKLLGWAIVKPKYFEVLSSNGLGLVAIGQKADKTKVLLDISSETISEISRKKLDELF